MKNILVYISINTQFKSVLPIVKFIIDKKIANPILLFDNHVHILEEAVEYCKSNKIAFFEINKTNINYIVDEKQKTIIQSVSFITEIKNLLLFPYRTIKQINIYNKKIKAHTILLKKYQIKTLILTVQGLGGDIPFLIKASKKLNIPSVVFPFAVTANGILRIKRENPLLLLDKISNKLLSNFIPRRAINIYKKKHVLLQPPFQVFALSFLKILPKNPWSSYSGGIDYIIAESNYMKDFLLNEGVNKKQIIELGSLSFDSINFANNYILCAFPPLSFNENANLPEFSTNKNATIYWFNILSRYSSDNKIVLHLHPRLNKNDFVDLAQKYNLEIRNDAIEELIPMCKFFITSVSSTIRLAIAYGKPVLDYDIFAYDYHSFKNNEGVITVFTKNDFENTIDKMINDKKYFKKIKRKQLTDAKYFGNTDNKNTERFALFFEKLLK